jgi:hypothetical protein
MDVGLRVSHEVDGKLAARVDGRSADRWHAGTVPIFGGSAFSASDQLSSASYLRRTPPIRLVDAREAQTSEVCGVAGNHSPDANRSPQDAP